MSVAIGGRSETNSFIAAEPEDPFADPLDSSMSLERLFGTMTLMGLRHDLAVLGAENETRAAYG